LRWVAFVQGVRIQSRPAGRLTIAQHVSAGNKERNLKESVKRTTEMLP